MAYKVVPFNAQIQAGEGAARAAAQLEALVNQYASNGWTFHGLETIDTTIVTPATPGTNGCLGLGAIPSTPEQRASVSAYVAVFSNS
ncbi:hypothetical protein [Nocardioides sp. W7]|uniref:hypothetical protein n=1 Tax=Nocardioides sp. W7 TaxID=2931390 RepID=UPI001FD32355|nr:hypothetical protein [Nocardioides sp. W7]